MASIDFENSFRTLTGFEPFGWQRRLFDRFVEGDVESCSTCRLPTGLGKTSLLHLWLIALAKNPTVVPRRLVYVVNRRTVVDQTTFEAEQIRRRLPATPEVEKALRDLCSVVDDDDTASCPLAISTLRGQFADNRQWISDPCRPAIVSGTVDMIGSRLLFDGYRCGFKSKPMHAGFLGTDALLIHDEAHLEPAFQALCESLQQEQASGRFPEFDASRRFKVIELSATTRRATQFVKEAKPPVAPFMLLQEEHAEPVLQKRIEAKKGIVFHRVGIESEMAGTLVELAQVYSDSGQAILVFVRKVSDLKKVAEELSKGREKKLPQNVTQLAGPTRGYERERLATEDPVFQRFLPESSRSTKVKPAEGTVYLVSTSAGEVGVNISADHMVADLTTFDSLAQRLGRVNRFGEGDAQVDLVAADSILDAGDDELKPMELAMKRTWSVTQRLPERDDGRRDASSAALGDLDPEDVADAFSPRPEILPADECLWDAWSLTTLAMPSFKRHLPGRPPIEDWLHGVGDDDPPQSQVAWRREVTELTDELLSNQTRPISLPQVLEAYPLKPHELLSDRTSRIFDGLKAIVQNFDKTACDDASEDPLNVWIVDHKGAVTRADLRKIADPSAKANDRKRLEQALAYQTIVLSDELRGLDSHGMLIGKRDATGKIHDVADNWFNESGEPLRLRYQSDNITDEIRTLRKSMRQVLRIRVATSESDDEEQTEMVWCVRRREFDDESLSYSSSTQQDLGAHLASAEVYARGFVKKCGLGRREADAVVIAAKHHDLGKRRRLWQRGIGNLDYRDGVFATVWAKSGTLRPPVNRHYRHEFGSLADVLEQPDFAKLGDESQDLALHLIAAHHGRARPHFPPDESFDPERDDSSSAQIRSECPVRFARLQRRYGRWQLAWLESLVRAADYLASQRLIDGAVFELPKASEVTA